MFTFNVRKLFREKFGTWMQFSQLRRKPHRTTLLQLEILEDRWCPATATWTNAAKDENWTNPKNWSWSDPNLKNNYPGDTGSRGSDDVVFGTSLTCNLTVNLPGTLDGLNIPKTFVNLVNLGGNVTVSGAEGFSMTAGTLSVTGNLIIGATANNGGVNQWWGGTIAGNGTITIHGGELDVNTAASSVSPNIVVESASSNSPSGVDAGGGTTNGILKLTFTMNANLALAGASNGITIGLGGQVILDEELTAAQADQQGGITGGSNNVISIVGGGSLSRGTSSDNRYGQVLISVPVVSKGGNFTLFDSNTGANPTSAVHLTGTDSAGYSYDDPASDTIGGILEIGQRAKLLADHGININTANGMVRLDVGSLGTPTEVGNVNIDNGTLDFYDAVSGTTGTGYINGSLTLTKNSNLWENWNGNNADLLQVNGTLSLNNCILTMYGDTPPTKGTLINIIQVLNGNAINGDIGTFNWANHANTVFIHKIVPGPGNSTYYQVGQTSQ